MTDVRQLVRFDDEDGLALDPQPLMHYQDALENLAAYYSPTVADLATVSGVTDESDGNWLGLATNQLGFADNAISRYAYTRGATNVDGEPSVVSMIVKMDDLSEPSVGIHTDPSADFAIVLHGEIAEGITYIKSLGNSLYQVFRERTGDTTGIGNSGAFKYTTQSSKGFKLTGFQFYQNTTIEQLINAGPIFSEGVALATDRIDYEHSVENISNESFAMYMECEPEGAGLIAGCFLGYGIGEELVVNGDFAYDGDWTSSLGQWSIIDGKAVFAGDATLAENFDNSQISLEIGDSYLVEFECTTDNIFYIPYSGFGTQGNINIDTSGQFIFTCEETPVALGFRASFYVTNATVDNYSVRQLSATAYPSFRLTDRAGNTITADATVSTRHKVGIVANAEEALMDLYVDGIWAGETPYSGTLHDDLLDMFRFNEYPGGVWNMRTWKGGTVAQLKAKVEEAGL